MAKAPREKKSLFDKIDTWLLVVLIAVAVVVVVGIFRAIVGTLLFAVKAAVFIVVIAVAIRIAMAVTGHRGRKDRAVEAPKNKAL